MNDHSFGGLLRWFVGQPDLSQHRIVQLSGYGTDTISRLANDRRLPTEVQALRIAASLLLNKQELKVMNRFLEAANLIPLPVPGKDICDHGEYRPNGRSWTEQARRRSLEVRRTHRES